MEKIINVIKYVWLGISLFALVTGIYYTAKGEWKDGLFFFVIVAVAMVMFRINLRPFPGKIKLGSTFILPQRAKIPRIP